MEQLNLIPKISGVAYPSFRSRYQEFKHNANYRNAAPISFERCQTCKNLIKTSCNGRTYYKCQLQGLSNGSATDIRLKNVCDKWTRK